MPRLEIRSRARTPAASRISASSRIVSASTAGSSEPIASAPICQNWRKRPFCGRSRRKYAPKYHSFTGCGCLCMPCSMYARQTGAVPSGRSVMLSESPPSSVYISFCTTSVDSPTPRANSSVASNAGVSIRW